MTEGVVPYTAFSDPRDLERTTSGGEYLPELDYAGRQYQPFGTRIKADSPLKPDKVFPPEGHFCNRCVSYYRTLAEKKFYDPADFPERGWPIKCSGDRSLRIQTITEEMMDEYVANGLVEDTDEGRARFRLTYDPVKWAELELGIVPDWYQAEMLRCSSQYKVARAGRRVGKSYSMEMEILWRAFTKDGKQKDRFEILIICPYEAQVKRIFDELLVMLNRSDALRRSYKRHAKSPWEIELNNGSIIRGFSAGRKTGAKSDKVRGQGADGIYFDEIDYMSDDDIETVLASQASQKDTFVWMTSTPTGARSKMWTMCHSKELSYKEFHYISAESPRWDSDTERMMKAVYSAGGYEREFYAEFGTPTSGVFRQQDLDRCLRKYTYEETRYKRNPEWKYVLGVDWNKYTGTHLIVLERGHTEKGVFYKVVDKKIIRKAEFQQHAGVEEVIRMAMAWNVDFVYVDQGYGDMQVENLWRQDLEHPELKLDFARKLKAIHGNQNIVIRDPRNPAMEITKAAKPFMVDLLSAWVSANVIFFPEEEDTESTLVEEEIPFLNIGLVQQMRAFRVEKYSPTGQPRYTQGYEHTLMALCFAVLGMAENFTEINEFTPDTTLKVHKEPFGVKSSTEPEKKLEEGETAKAKELSLYERTLPNRTTDTRSTAGAYAPSDVGLPARRSRPSWSNLPGRTIP
jgi:hypothetical protein